MGLPNLDDIPPELPGDDQTLSWIAWSLQQVANSAATASQQLNSARSQMQWTGLAADQFINTLGDLPDHLSKVSVAYGAGARAVRNYVSSLDPYRSPWRFDRTRFSDALDEYATLSRSGVDTSSAEDTGKQVLGTLQSHWDQATMLAAQLSSKLNDAANQGDKNGILNTIERYGGDAGGFVWNQVTDVVNAAEDFVTTAIQLMKDVEAGNWGAVLTDLHQMLTDFTTILNAVLMVASFIPGLGEIVMVLKVVMLVVAVVMVAADLVQGGMDVAQHGWGYALSQDGGTLFGDTVNVLSSGKGVKDARMEGRFQQLYGESNPEAGSLSASIRSEKGWVTRYTNKGDLDAAAAAQGRVDHLTGLQSQIADIPDKPNFSSISDFRQARSDMQAGHKAIGDALGERNPVVANPFGMNVTYHQYQTVTSAISHGYETGKSIHEFTDDPSAKSAPGLEKSLHEDYKGAKELK
jgi:hypothetical protein